MTNTLISLLTIVIGIVGAKLMGIIFKKYSFGVIGNSIAGVFGNVFFIKSMGRLGFDPRSIMQTGEVNTVLFAINILVSLLVGAIGLMI